jgi:hypothetical protein
VCIDSEFDGAASQIITRIQNAIMMHERSPRTIARFKLTTMSNLTTCIAKTILALDFADAISSEMAGWLTDDTTKRRFLFLLYLLPNLTVLGTLYWLKLSIDNNGPQTSLQNSVSIWFQRLLCDPEEESKRLASALEENPSLNNFLNPSIVCQVPFLARAELRSCGTNGLN